MTNGELRDKVNTELRKMGQNQPEKLSNKEACKILGLIPGNVIGIGTVNGRKLLKAYYEGRSLTYEQLGGYIRKEPTVHISEAKPGTSKKVMRARRKRKFALRQEFYAGKEWQQLRYQALVKNGGACQCCGRKAATHGVVIHVDHIKPRSLFPHLELMLDNLQVLCEDCNLAKSNKDETDWRPQVAA